MAAISQALATVYLAPSRRRRYFSAKSAANAEARFLVQRRFERDGGEGYFRLDTAYERLYSRFVRRLLRSLHPSLQNEREART